MTLDILERLKSSAAYMDEKTRDRFVVTAESLHGAIAEIEQLRAALTGILDVEVDIPPEDLIANMRATAAVALGLGPKEIAERYAGEKSADKSA